MKRKMTALAMTAVMAVPLAGQVTVKAEETPKLTILVDEMTTEGLVSVLDEESQELGFLFP